MATADTKVSRVACIQQHNACAGFEKQHSLFCAGYKKADKGRVACEDEAVEHLHLGFACGNYCAACGKRLRDSHDNVRTSALVRFESNGRHS